MKYHRTAIGRTKASVPVRWLLKSGEIARDEKILDYGCGRGADADFLGCDGWDPQTDNPRHKQYPTGKYDVVLCTYVLNVLHCPSEREQVIQRVTSLLAPGGRAYFTVRRDIPKTGTPTQAYVVLPGMSLVRLNTKLEIGLWVSQ